MIIPAGYTVRYLIFHAFWILGLALLLAAFSYHYEQAHRLSHSLRQQLQRRSFTGAAWLSLTLIGVGVAGTSRQMWEAAVWILLTLYAAWQTLSIWLSREQTAED